MNAAIAATILFLTLRTVISVAVGGGMMWLMWITSLIVKNYLERRNARG